MNKYVLFLFLSLTLIFNAACSGKSNYPEPVKIKTKTQNKNTEIVWTAKAGSGNKKENLFLRPAYDDGKIYAVSSDGNLYVFDAQTGKKTSRFKLKNNITAGLTVGGGLVFLGTKNGDVLAISAANGKPVWRSQLESQMLAPAALEHNLLAVYASGGDLTAFDPNDGEKLWSYHVAVPLLSMRGTTSPIIGGDFVILTADSGEFSILNAKTGLPVFKETITNNGSAHLVGKIIDQDATPKITPNGLLIASSYQNRVYAVDLTKGSIAWQNEQFSTRLNFAIDNENVYLVAEHDEVVALSLSDGHKVWSSSELKGHHLSSPVIANGFIGVINHDGKLFWLDKNTGKVSASKSLGGYPAASEALVIDNLIIWQLTNGKLVAIRP